MMEKRVALIGIVVENFESTERINSLLHEYREYVVGRMGIPRVKNDVAVISIVLDAPGNAINTLSGKLGMLPGVNTKTIYSNLTDSKKEGNT